MDGGDAIEAPRPNGDNDSRPEPAEGKRRGKSETRIDEGGFGSSIGSAVAGLIQIAAQVAGTRVPGCKPAVDAHGLCSLQIESRGSHPTVNGWPPELRANQMTHVILGSTRPTRARESRFRMTS